jgi:hypothetical protein
MTTFETFLAVTILIAALVQVALLFFLYRAIATLAKRIEKLIDVVEPELHELAEGARAVRVATEATAREVQAGIAGIRAATTELSAMARSQGEDIRQAVQRATSMAEHQLEEANQAIDRARDRLVDLGSGIDRAVLDPLRATLAVATGVRRAVGVLLGPGHRRDGAGRANIGGEASNGGSAGTAS